jgi:hypothetical protein
VEFRLKSKKEVKLLAIKVKLSAIIDGIEFQDDQVTSYLNLKTGQVISLTDAAFSAAEEEDEENIDFCDIEAEEIETAREILNDEDSYLALPSQFDINEYEIMENFCLEIENPKIKDIICRSINGSGAFRRFKNNIHNFDIQDDWYHYRDEKLKEITIEWCEENKIELLDDRPTPMDEPRLKLDKSKIRDLHSDIKPGKYRHYKGKEYEVIGIAKHSENLEEFVVYRALYGDGELWLRPREMFSEQITFEGLKILRFEYIGGK